MSTPADKLKDSPDYKCKAHCEMADAVKLMRDVFGGTPTIRKARTVYLPQEPAESDARYNNRLARSVFFNATRKTRDALVGMVFKHDPVIGEDVPEAIKALLENIDLCGNHLDVFAKELFTDAVGEGHAFILVDMQGALPPGASRADEIASGRRPYCVKYKGDQAINWFFDQINGENVLVQITFEECKTERDGEYTEKDVTRQRTFRLPILDDGTDNAGNQIRPAVFGQVEWELQRKMKSETGGVDVWITEKSGKMIGPTRIPLAPVYGRKKGEFCSEPPLLDQAYLNISHYQESSDLKNVLHVANVPILTRAGAPESEVKKGFAVGGNAVVDIGEKPAADLFYCEHEAKATSSSRESIMDLEQRMSAMGLSLIAAKHDREITLGEKKMDQDERTSELANMARSLKDCFEAVFGFMAQFLGVADKDGYGGSVEIGVDESIIELDAQSLSVLYQMYLAGDLTLDTLLKLMARNWKGVDLENELARIEEQRVIRAKELAQRQLPPASQSPGNGNMPPNGSQGQGPMNGDPGQMKQQAPMSGGTR